jgi:DOMON domain
MTSEIQWDHRVDLDDNFQLLWRVKRPDIIFEVRVRTHGYVGFGFARSEYIYGSDMVVGWVDNKHTFFQVSNKSAIILFYFIYFSISLTNSVSFCLIVGQVNLSRDALV